MTKETDAIEAYAAAGAEDISSTDCSIVEFGQLQHGWAGTVYGKMVGKHLGYRFPTRTEAEKNAAVFVKQCQSILSLRVKK